MPPKKKSPSELLLNPKRFTEAITDEPEYQEQVDSLGNLSEEDQKARVSTAMARTAFSISSEIQEKRGEYDLDGTLYKLMGSIEGFHNANKRMRTLRNQYRSPRDMPRHEKQEFYDSKDQLIAFNDALHEVINASGGRFNFQELLDFMSGAFLEFHPQEEQAGFKEEAKNILVGIRNEIGTEQVLIAGDVEYEIDPAADKKGGDFTIEGVNIDVKASEDAARKSREKAERNGYDPRTIIWSHIHFKDFKGELTLPYDVCEEIFARLKPDLDAAIASRRTL